MSKIGVFDSGVGGQSVATAIGLGLPDDDVIFVNDSLNVPYGTKTEDELYEMALPKLQQLADQGCRVIVIACNSVSTTILDKLQKDISVPLIGVEPLIEQAVEKSSSKVIAVCATPRTLASSRYKELCAQYAVDSVVVEPDCSEWALMIENDAIDRAKIKIAIEDVIQQGADTIVLGCTHYHWIESLIRSIANGKAQIIQPEEFIVGEVRQALLQLS
jgi:glutamate racemase